MKTEMQVLEALKDAIAEKIESQYYECDDKALLEQIKAGNVEIGFPDEDNMRKNTMFYLTPDYMTYEALGTQSDISCFYISIFILCKGASPAILLKKAFAYYTALYCLINKDQTLEGLVDFIDITEADYFPSVGNASLVGIEVKTTVQWTKEL